MADTSLKALFERFWQHVVVSLNTKADKTTLGSLENLTTSDKSNLVAAINEATASGGVQSDWNDKNSSSLAHILNQPDIKKDGCKGYEIYKLYADPDREDKKKCIVVAPAIPSTDWVGGDRISFDIGGTYTYGFTIDEIVHKSNGAYSLIHTIEALPDKTAASGETMYVWNLDKPQSGDIELGIGAIAQGIDTTAIGKGAVALNRDTKAEGNFSFAANRGTVAGYGAASFGKSTEARGTHSFTSGWGTIAGSDYQQVEGKFNTIDTEDKYAHIVGNGTGVSDSKRSNAYTLDWGGNAWFAGDITIGPDKQIIATEQYVDGLVGDIESALDSIIATQESLIGGET